MTSTASYVKDGQAVLDYEFDWSPWLADTETITEHTITAGADLTVASTSATDSTVTVWLSGGTVGDTTRVVCHITTSAGRQDDRSIRVTVEDR